MQNVSVISRQEMRRRARNISRITEWRQIQNNPDWPRLVQLTAGLQGYLEDEVNAYFEKLAVRPDADRAGASP